MMLLSRKTITREIYLDEEVWPFFIPSYLLWVPLAWGLWFQSWWVWFGVLAFLAGGMVIFFLFINLYFWAASALVVYSIGWGGVGYSLGLLFCPFPYLRSSTPYDWDTVLYHCSWHFSIPLLNHHRHDKLRG